MHCSSSPASLPPLQIVFTAISLCAPVASGLAMAFPVFALSVYQLPGGHPDNPLGVHSLDTEQGSWFGQHSALAARNDDDAASSAKPHSLFFNPPTQSNFALKNGTPQVDRDSFRVRAARPGNPQCSFRGTCSLSADYERRVVSC